MERQEGREQSQEEQGPMIMVSTNETQRHRSGRNRLLFPLRVPKLNSAGPGTQ